MTKNTGKVYGLLIAWYILLVMRKRKTAKNLSVGGLFPVEGYKVWGRSRHIRALLSENFALPCQASCGTSIIIGRVVWIMIVMFLLIFAKPSKKPVFHDIFPKFDLFPRSFVSFLLQFCTVKI
jgi:hypothetical protein